MGDGDGWVQCRCGERHWGRFGAVGLLLGTPDGRVLVQHRAEWTHEGGRWGLPGGARDGAESAVEAALREGREEAGPAVDGAVVLGERAGTDHVDWSYRYVLAVVDEARAPLGNAESQELAWIPAGEVPRLPLIAGLARDWAGLSAAFEALVGARPSPEPATATPEAAGGQAPPASRGA